MTVVAIGGGEISEGETIEIDEKIVELTRKEKPKALFIPTASGDAKGYIQVFEKVYGEKLGCETDALKLVEENPSREEVREELIAADLIYVGGNTKLMLKHWKEYNLGEHLKEAEQNGIILSGLSARAVWWFEKAMTDSEKFEKDNWNYEIEEMLGFIPNTVVCPHYSNQEIKEEFKKKSDKLEGEKYGLEDCAAVKISKGEVTVLEEGEGNVFEMVSRKEIVLTEN